MRKRIGHFQFQSSQMWWAERRRVGAPTIFQMHVDFGINLVGERPSKWAPSLENNDKILKKPIRIECHIKLYIQIQVFPIK